MFLVCLTGARIYIIVALKQRVGYQKIASPPAAARNDEELGSGKDKKQRLPGFAGSRCLSFFFR